MKPETAQKILEETKRNFDKIAEEFSESRKQRWEIMKVFTDYVKEGDKVLDVGCGNGRLFELFKDRQIEYTGVDNSEKLIEIAKKNFQFPISNFQTNSKFKFLVADALDLSFFKDEEFDSVFMIAVLPHIPSKELQMKAINEAYRVLKIDGWLFITCWNLLQPKLFFENFIQRFKNPKLYQRLSWRDFFIPWHSKNGEIIAQRFYHLFTKRELKKILKFVGFKVLEIYYEKRGKKSNWLKGANLVALAKK